MNGKSLNAQLNTDKSDYNEYLRVIGSEYDIPAFNSAIKLDANTLDDKSKIELIERHFSEIMNILGLNLSDDSIKDTPHRVANVSIILYPL